ncbi:ahpC/TSA family protein [Lyngbya aestuarii BL J]|uniref:thioredoxin-dependent peroxiredoxin n=1 Tax=Lyngbya aestuarii BL J TaxID=1348334 RepID=U7Q9Z0_9CYAN|nr:ahpC/TSA family protein [Lyngbya aestuarii BL J]
MIFEDNLWCCIFTAARGHKRSPGFKIRGTSDPRDHTPGCTKEACGFRDLYAEYRSQNIAVLGVSTDDAKSHAKFVSKHQLPFPLLSDEGGKVASLYGSYGLKKFMGREFMGVYRHTFVIDADGQLVKIYRKVKPADHAAEVLKLFTPE